MTKKPDQDVLDHEYEQGYRAAFTSAAWKAGRAAGTQAVKENKPQRPQPMTMIEQIAQFSGITETQARDAVKAMRYPTSDMMTEMIWSGFAMSESTLDYCKAIDFVLKEGSNK